MLSWGLRVTGNGLDTTDACVSSCVHFLPQPSLHLAVLLFKNAVSCGLLTSISLACIWLQTSRPCAFHFCTGVGGFLLHLSVSLSLLLEGVEDETPDHSGIFAASQILDLGDR